MAILREKCIEAYTFLLDRHSSAGYWKLLFIKDDKYYVTEKACFAYCFNNNGMKYVKVEMLGLHGEHERFGEMVKKFLHRGRVDHMGPCTQEDLNTLRKI